jgi:putative ABC transport system ATP-binding protein
VIEIENLCKVYHGGLGADTIALDGVSLKVDDGEFVAIMGPSGSGKSTLMNILGCLDTPTSGTYRLDGEDVSQLDDDELADIRNLRIGFVFQSFNLLPRATVMRNVLVPLLYSGFKKSERYDRAAASLEAAGLPEAFWEHRSNELSGGQMQRVAIARALVTDPGLILADEPTGNLDTKTGEQVLSTFQRLNDGGRTIVLITHEPDIGQHAKRIVHVQDGLILSDEVNAVQRRAGGESDAA